MSVYELRTLCNKRGLSCRDTNNKYLPKKQLLELLENQSGGGHTYNHRDPYNSVKIFAGKWWDNEGRMVWWSDGQDGYYFSNSKHNWKGNKKHTHIYEVYKSDAAGNRNSGGNHFTYNYTATDANGHVAGHTQATVTFPAGNDGFTQAITYFRDLNQKIEAY